MIMFVGAATLVFWILFFLWNRNTVLDLFIKIVNLAMAIWGTYYVFTYFS